MMPACGPPSSLSPLNVTRSAPRASDSVRRGLVRQAPLREVDQAAAAQVGDERQTLGVREGASSASSAAAMKPTTA